jgi:transposase
MAAHGEDDPVEEVTEEAAGLVARVAALDIGKAELVCCVRVPHERKPGARRQEVRSFATTTRALLELRDWLSGLGVALCVMEATSTYWKPPFYLLEDVIECWVVNARDVKNVPGRPKTDKLDAIWLCKLAERGMLRPSFIPPPWQRELRDLCRYRRTLVQERAREKQRAEKLLEDTQIKLSSVISDIFGKSGRAMLEALIAGQRDPQVLAELAMGRMRAKKSVLQEALTGHFRDHHGYLLRMMCDHVDALSAQIETLTGRIDEAIAPFAHQVAQLDEIPGIGRTGAQELIAEIGVDMARFPTAGHLVSWAKYAPRARQSAGKNKPGSTGKGNPWIAGTLGEAGIGAARTKTFLGARYHRLARRRGKQRALVAVGNSILVIAWHLLSNPEARFTDLGPGWHDRLAPLRRKRQLVAELERLSGKKVVLQEAAA